MILNVLLKAPLFVLIALACALPAQALECRYCDGKGLGQLIELSVSRFSPALRAQIRGWLAQTHPDTGAGYVARAWVAKQNGALPDEVIRLYQEGIRRDPSLGLAYFNLGVELELRNFTKVAAEFHAK